MYRDELRLGFLIERPEHNASQSYDLDTLAFSK